MCFHCKYLQLNNKILFCSSYYQTNTEKEGQKVEAKATEESVAPVEVATESEKLDATETKYPNVSVPSPASPTIKNPPKTNKPDMTTGEEAADSGEPEKEDIVTPVEQEKVENGEQNHTLSRVPPRPPSTPSVGNEATENTGKQEELGAYVLIHHFKNLGALFFFPDLGRERGNHRNASDISVFLFPLFSIS